MPTIEELWDAHRPNQNFNEWKAFLMFCKAYFEGITTDPIVVEIGSQGNQQKWHYEGYLHAIHYGIDITDKYGKPDILGNSHTLMTYHKLAEALHGNSIDILFIDGEHTYDDAMQDYRMYGPLVAPDGMIAFHDICYLASPEMAKVWYDLQKEERANPHVTFMTFAGNGCLGRFGGEPGPLGIGLIVRSKNYEYAKAGITKLRAWKEEK